MVEPPLVKNFGLTGRCKGSLLAEGARHFLLQARLPGRYRVFGFTSDALLREMLRVLGIR